MKTAKELFEELGYKDFSICKNVNIRVSNGNNTIFFWLIDKSVSIKKWNKQDSKIEKELNNAINQLKKELGWLD